jgi:hypothetical protein
MKYTHGIGFALLVAGLTACHTVPVRLDNIPMMWKPTSEIVLPPGTLSGMLGTKVQFSAFKDMRKNPQLVAENREDPTPKLVTTHDNIGEFVSTHVRSAFDRLGLTTVDSNGDVVVGGDVRQFFVDETSTYKGNILLHLNVRNRAGKTLWTGVASGTATRFGRSYSKENYYEVFSDSILNAVATLVQDVDFQAALARKK